MTIRVGHSPTETAPEKHFGDIWCWGHLCFSLIREERPNLSSAAGFCLYLRPQGRDIKTSGRLKWMSCKPLRGRGATIFYFPIVFLRFMNSVIPLTCSSVVTVWGRLTRKWSETREYLEGGFETGVTSLDQHSRPSNKSLFCLLSERPATPPHPHIPCVNRLWSEFPVKSAALLTPQTAARTHIAYSKP